MIAFSKRRIRGKAPLSVGAHRGVTHLNPVIKQDDLVARLAAAAQGRAGVIGALTIHQYAGDRSAIICYHRRGGLRRGEIHHDRKGRRGRTGIACAVGGADGKIVRPFAQRSVRGKAPVAAVICLYRTNFRAVIENAHRSARFRCSAQRGLRVAGELAAGQRL